MIRLIKTVVWVMVFAFVVSLFTMAARGANFTVENKVSPHTAQFVVTNKVVQAEAKKPFTVPLDYFERHMDTYGGPMVLVVGDGPNPLADRGVLHCVAPTGYKGLKDGRYTAYGKIAELVTIPFPDNPVGKVGACIGCCTPGFNCRDAGCPATGGAGCSCIAQPKATPKAVSPPVAVAPRAPHGHTHTCSNGHTWDHSVTSSHNCPVCGTFQNVQDPSPRTATAAPTNVSPFQTGTVTGGCPNGNCAVPQRGGIFRRR